MSNELITVRYNEQQEPYVMGRDLHEKLEIRTVYMDWFPRMCEYGFAEGTDFISILRESTGGRPSMDHQLTIDMAKQICMLQKTSLGKTYREYFLELEKKWNSPEYIMARAHKISEMTIARLTSQNAVLLEANKAQAKLIAKMEPESKYYQKVLRCQNAIPITIIAKDYGMGPKKMNKLLHELGIQYKATKDTWVLYQQYANKGYTKTDTHYNEYGAFVHTKWTQAGREFIFRKLKDKGILPVYDKTGIDPTGDEDINYVDNFENPPF